MCREKISCHAYNSRKCFYAKRNTQHRTTGPLITEQGTNCQPSLLIDAATKAEIETIKALNGGIVLD